MKISSRRYSSPRRLAVVTLVVSLGLAACGGADSQDAPTNGQDEEEVASPSEDAEGDGAESEDQESEQVQIRFANILPPGDAISQAFDWWMDDLEATDETLTFEHQYGGALLPGTEIMAGVGAGRAEGGMVVPAYHPGELPLLNIAGVPVPYDAETRARALHELVWSNEIVADELVSQGVRPLAFTMVASPWGLASAEPVDGPSDLAGMRIRVLPGVETPYETFGAEPVFLSAEEQYEGLQRGTIDGVLQNMNTWEASSLHEVAPYMYVHGIGAFGAGMLVLNEDVWQSLGGDRQSAMTEAVDRYYDQSVELFASVEEESCDRILESDAQILRWDDAAIEEFEGAIGTALVDGWVDRAVEAGLEEAAVREVWAEYERLLEDHAGNSTYVSGMEECLARQG